VVTRRRERGYSLIEIVFALAIFGTFILILTQLTADMTFYERKYTVNFLTHPQVAAVVSRLRRDVADATPPYYPDSAGTYSQGPKTLILDILEEGGVKHVVWDFSTKGEVHRISTNVGVETEWVARGVPDFQVTDRPVENKPDSVRILATDEGGALAVDQIFQPRPHT
jgi:prepilin-type N-terminal cleavage/methylation domain-containing protein